MQRKAHTATCPPALGCWPQLGITEGFCLPGAAGTQPHICTGANLTLKPLLCLLQAGWAQVLQRSCNMCFYLQEFSSPAHHIQNWAAFRQLHYTGQLHYPLKYKSFNHSSSPGGCHCSSLQSLEIGMQEGPGLRPPFLHLPRSLPRGFLWLSSHRGSAGCPSIIE